MNNAHITSATRQVRQQWFSVGIFPLGRLFGLTGNRPQSAPCSFLLYCTHIKNGYHEDNFVCFDSFFSNLWMHE